MYSPEDKFGGSGGEFGSLTFSVDDYKETSKVISDSLLDLVERTEKISFMYRSLLADLNALLEQVVPKENR